MKVLKVTKNGSVRWGAYWWVYVSASLMDRYIGVEEVGNGIWKAFYRNVFLVTLTKKILETKKNQ